jgi:hypothetical protein
VSKLVIVESPAKSKTIKKYLGKDFEVLASFGHVRDLLPKAGAVDTEHDFAMRYQLVERNAKHVNAICKNMEKADTLYLATDPDYVEIHNSSSVLLRQLFQMKYLQYIVPTSLREKVEDTFMLPEKYRGVSLGWAVSSDAHFPTDQVYVGGTDENMKTTETYFNFLKRRIRFDPHQVNTYSNKILPLIKNGQCVFLEALLKKYYKLFK